MKKEELHKQLGKPKSQGYEYILQPEEWYDRMIFNLQSISNYEAITNEECDDY